ncbi:MAG: hypothetical protein WBI40_07580 [Methylococcaceae bacterium]
MATTSKLVQEAKTSLTFATSPTGVSNLGYSVSDAVDTTANDPLDVIVEVRATQSAALVTSSNQQLVAFALGSLDATNFTGGAITSADESSMRFLGTLPLRTQNQSTANVFSIYSAFGFVPSAFKVVIKIDNGANAGLSAFSAATAEITGTSV